MKVFAHKISVKYIMLFLTLCLAFLMSGCLRSSSDEVTFTDQEKEELSKFDIDFIHNADILKIKKDGKMQVFTETVKDEFEKICEERNAENDQMFSFWGISPDATAEDLIEPVQKYLDQYDDGIEVDGLEFRKLVQAYISTDEYGTARKSREESEFGAVYVYMCIYYDQIILDEENSENLESDTVIILPKEISSKKIKEIIEDEIRKDFVAHNLPDIISKMLDH